VGAMGMRPVSRLRLAAARAGVVPVGLLATTLVVLAAAVLAPGAARWLAAGAAVLVVVGATRVLLIADRAARDRDEVAAARHRLEAILAGASDVVLIVADGEVTYQSPSIERRLGYAPGQLLGRRYLDLVHPDDREHTVAYVHDLLREQGRSGLLECRLRAADGRYVPAECSCRNLLDDATVAGFVVTARDVSERRRLEEQLARRDLHDPLTDLPNRSLLVDRLEHTGARLGRLGGTCAVLHVDLDGFRRVNDALGRDAGDTVLVAAARRLEHATRRADTIARIGPNEFGILLDQHHEPVAVARVARRVLEELRQPVPTASDDVHLTASIGIAFADIGDDAADVLRNAELACGLARRNGRDRFEVFEPRMHDAVVERLHLESDLQRALEGDELEVHYQPIVTLTDRRTVGVEALVRWRHPVRGTISPVDFVPLAEETGGILAIGRFVLREACAQMARWRLNLPGAEELTVSVNVSMRQLSAGDLVADVEDALSATGLPADALTLELTESALVRDADRALDLLHRLKRLGVRLAIDDFGTGYSSLAYLHRFPVDVLKIDRSFVASVVTGRQSPALARAIVDLGRSLDLLTVAEGIERDAELAQFRELDCALGQGYLFARPADATTTAAALTDAIAVQAAARGPR
jgi:diguanylate cyclase (GGDEF)-like protein/PAS domain S-box-containing protein